jgi:hypothetical protein
MIGATHASYSQGIEVKFQSAGSGASGRLYTVGTACA